MNSPVSYENLDGIATIMLDDGKANVMNIAMISAIRAALDRAEAERAVVVIHGRAGMFSGGFDLSVFKKDRRELLEMLNSGAELTEQLLAFPYPVVMVCTGHAIAMGTFLLLSADYRIGTRPEAKIQVNEVQIGMTVPHFALEVCKQRLLPAHASLAAITANPYDQRQGVTIGFLDELTTPEALPDTLKRCTDHLRNLKMDAFTATKLRLRGEALKAMRLAIADDVEDWNKSFANVG